MNEAITDNELELVMRKLSGERKERAYFMRKSVKSLMDKLTGNLPEAMYHIGLAQTLYEAPKGFKTVDFLAVSGKPRDDLSNWEIDLKKRYENWRGVLANSYFATYICEQICQNEKLVAEIARQERLTNHTVEKLLLFGLNEFCIVSGWGEQLKNN